MIGMTETITATSDQACDLRIWSPGRTRTCNLLFTRQQRIVHGVLSRVLLAARVGWVVQSVRSRGPSDAWWNDMDWRPSPGQLPATTLLRSVGGLRTLGWA
jgi:hypothetical protein